MKKKRKMTSRLHLMYIVAILPLRAFGLYKNGVIPYIHNYVDIMGALKPLILILTSISASFLANFLKEYRTTKKIDSSIFDKSKATLIESALLAMMLPLKSSPLILFIVVFLSYMFFGKVRFNRVAAIYIIIAIINRFLGLNYYLNPYQAGREFSYNGLDLFLGLGEGGICSTSVLLIAIALLYLSFSNLYKKDLVIPAIIAFLVFGIGANMISGNYAGMFESVFGNNALFALVFVAPNLYSSSYTQKGQTLYGIVLGLLTYALIYTIPYSAAPLAILLVNPLKNIFDRIFVIK